MSNHTPGPWFRNIRANGKYPTIFAGQNNHVANAVQKTDPNETESNIDLIAAAPELLNALKEMVDYYGSDSARVEALFNARAAIAKATVE